MDRAFTRAAVQRLLAEVEKDHHELILPDGRSETLIESAASAERAAELAEDASLRKSQRRVQIGEKQMLLYDFQARAVGVLPRGEPARSCVGVCTR